MPNRRFSKRSVGMAVVSATLLSVGIATLMAQSPLAKSQSPRERLEAMSPQEKEELAAKRARYEQLPAEEQQRLRKLDEQLSADPNAEQLRGVMNRYYEWLKTLSSEDRATLLSKSGEERIEMIRIMAFRSMADRRLSQEDLEQVYEWTTTYLRSREADMIQSLPEHKRDEVERIDDESRRWRHLFFLMRHNQIRSPAEPTEEEVTALIGELSTDARRIFAAAPDEEKRKELVQGWIRASMFSRYTQSIPEADLMKFLHEELDPRRRSEIEALPREEMQKELRKFYMFHKFRSFGGGPPRFRPPGGGPPGGPPNGRDDDRGPDDDRGRGNGGRDNDRRGGDGRGDRGRGNRPPSDND